MRSLISSALVGFAAGLAAAAAMEAFQTLAAKPFGQTGRGEPSTVKAAEAAGKAVTGDPVPQDDRALSGRLVHYATGASLGAVYGVLAERWPEAAAGHGIGYGLVTALTLDNGLVPALGLGASPAETSLSTHAYGLASHAVYGAALETARRAGAALLS